MKKRSTTAIGEAPETVTILSVSPNPEDHLALERIFTESAWDTYPHSCRQVSRASTLSSALTGATGAIPGAYDVTGLPLG